MIIVFSDFFAKDFLHKKFEIFFPNEKTFFQKFVFSNLENRSVESGCVGFALIPSRLIRNNYYIKKRLQLLEEKK